MRLGLCATNLGLALAILAILSCGKGSEGGIAQTTIAPTLGAVPVSEAMNATVPTASPAQVLEPTDPPSSHPPDVSPSIPPPSPSPHPPTVEEALWVFEYWLGPHGDRFNVVPSGRWRYACLPSRTTTFDWTFHRFLQWTPEGIVHDAVTRARQDEFEANETWLRTVKADGTDLRRIVLATAEVDYRSPLDATLAAFARDHPREAALLEPSVFDFLPTELGEPDWFGESDWETIRFVGGVAHFDVSQDGDRIVYSTCTHPDAPFTGEVSRWDIPWEMRTRDLERYDLEIVVSDIDGSDLVRLTSNSGSNVFPTWSPDGSLIAFLSTASLSPPQSGYLYTMAPDGSGIRSLNTGASLQPFAMHPLEWSPDGTRIAFVAGIDRETNLPPAVFTVDAVGELGPVRVSDTVGAVSWSPDGSRLAVAKLDGDTVALYTIAPDGSKASRITDITDRTTFEDLTGAVRRLVHDSRRRHQYERS